MPWSKHTTNASTAPATRTESAAIESRAWLGSWPLRRSMTSSLRRTPTAAGSHEWAAQELRRVTTTQLDAQLVRLFLNATSPPAPRPSRRRAHRCAAHGDPAAHARGQRLSEVPRAMVNIAKHRLASATPVRRAGCRTRDGSGRFANVEPNPAGPGTHQDTESAARTRCRRRLSDSGRCSGQALAQPDLESSSSLAGRHEEIIGRVIGADAHMDTRATGDAQRSRD